MTNTEKMILDEMLAEGTITRDVTFECDGKNVRQFTIELDGETYDMTQHDGEWVYLFHYINK